MKLEKIPSGISTNVESQAEDAVDPQEELSELRVEIDDNGDGIEELRQNLPHEKERLTENVTGAMWGLPRGCSGPWLQQAEIRIADEVLTVLAEAALENEQIGKAMGVMEAMEAMGMGTAQNLKKEENMVVARGEGSKSVQMGLAQTARQGIFAGTSKTKVLLLGKPTYLEYGLRLRERERESEKQELMQTWNAGHMMGAVLESKSKLQVHSAASFEATVQGALLAGLYAFCGAKRKLERERASSAGDVPKQAREALPCTDKEKLGH